MYQFNFRIKFGNNLKTSLVSDKLFHQFYQFIGGHLSDKKVHCPNELINIPISYKDALLFEVNAFKIIEEEFKFKEDDFSFFFHLDEPPKTSVAYKYINHIYDVFSPLSANKIIFLLENYDSFCDYSEIIDKLNNKLILINSEGEYLNGNISLTTDNSVTQFKKKLRNFKHQSDITKLDIEQNFQQKFVRHIGHFQKYNENNKHISCHKYFFDGDKCDYEISELLYSRVIQDIDETKTFAIYGHSPFLAWGQTSFARLHDSFYNNNKDIYQGKILNLDTTKIFANQIVLLLDVINSGATFKEIYRQTITKFPNSQILVYCVVDCYSSEMTDDLNGSFEMIFGATKIPIGFIIQKRQETYSKNREECPLCQNLNLTPKPFFEKVEPIGKLNTFEMWTMVSEAGTSPEIIGYDNRFSNELPNTLNILIQNQGLITQKFEFLLRENNIPFSNKDYIIFPDETENFVKKFNGVKTKFVPSSLLVSSLKLTYLYNFFGIPRSTIDEIKSDSSKLIEFDKNYPELFNELAKLDTKQVIIVDEFPKTYETYNVMLKVLDYVGIDVLLYFTLFNFTPNLIKEKVTATKHMNLYEFEID